MPNAKAALQQEADDMADAEITVDEELIRKFTEYLLNEDDDFACELSSEIGGLIQKSAHRFIDGLGSELDSRYHITAETPAQGSPRWDVAFLLAGKFEVRMLRDVSGLIYEHLARKLAECQPAAP